MCHTSNNGQTRFSNPCSRCETPISRFDNLCRDCADEIKAEQQVEMDLATRNANPDEERELAEEPGEEGGLLNEIDSMFAGIDFSAIPCTDDHTKVIYAEDIGEWLVVLPDADGEMPYGDDVEFTHPEFSE